VIEDLFSAFFKLNAEWINAKERKIDTSQKYVETQEFVDSLLYTHRMNSFADRLNN